MELRELAEQVLFGASLADKLVEAGALSDLRPGAALACPPAPTRPPELAFGSAPPPPREPRTERDRGLLLHSFANHELLAAELMALMLLRFPEAPRAFRLGLAGALREEQAHLRLYLDRMATVGLSLGEQPLNRFFWDCLAGVPDPMGFVAGMSLGFEQANLDFGLWWARRFRAAGDEGTAAVLERVVEDELGHVRLGLHWLRRWREPALDDFAAWSRALPAPLTPARGRGPEASPELRERVGFDATFARQLFAFGASRGRTPDLYLFDPSCEDRIAGEDSAAGRALAEDLGLLPIVFAGRDDVVALLRRPSEAFLSQLTAMGFELPELAEVGDLAHPTADVLSDRALSRLIPWGWHPELAAQVSRGPAAWEPAWRASYDKRQAAKLDQEWRAVLSQDPRVIPQEDVSIEVERLSQVEDAVRYFCDRGHAEVLLKLPFGTAGRGMRRWRGGEARAWAERGLMRQGKLLVEPRFERVADLSAHLDAGESPVFRGLSAFEVNPAGRWMGSVVGPVEAALTPELRRFLHADGREPGWLEALMRRVCARVQAPPGPAGVDFFIARTAAGLQLRPVVELNPRFTMGRVALALRGRLAPRRVGWWTVVSAREVGGDLAAWLRARPAPVFEEGLASGVLSFSEPRPGLRFAGVLAVGRSVAEARALVSAGG